MNESIEELPLPAIAILGLGSMGGAIFAGLRAPGVRVQGTIRVTNRTVASAEQYTGLEGVISLATEAEAEANREAVRGARIVLLAVKPFLILDVLREVADVLDPNAIVVSVAAGVTIESMQQVVGEGVEVLRAMPNTPSLIGRGVTGLSAGPQATETDLALVEQLFATVGEVVTLPESQIDALSAFSGSGPAYVFLLIEEMTKAAIRLGFTQEQADTMVRGTFAGAADLVAVTGEDPAELRRKVTSPKGTTERAIAVLQEAELAALFGRAAEAAIARAQELAKG